MKPITFLSPAKLNLFLHITGQRKDGYHELQTLFQLLDYGDSLRFSLRDDNDIVIQPPVKGVELQDNLIYKAALALENHVGFRLGVDIYLDKHLPMGGGLGGGSSNAATTLIALNHLWRTHLPLEALAKIGLSLGADVPVFVHGRSAWAEGIGEKLTPVDTPQQWFLVIKPNCHVATADIFSSEELTRDTTAITVAAFFERGGKNDCENVVCNRYPEVKKAIDWLNNYSPAKLTGTGACIFAQFSSEAKAKAILKKVPMEWECFVAKGINSTPSAFDYL